MKKALCCILAALLAVLPCCGFAEKSFYEANREEIEYYRQFIPLYINESVAVAGYDESPYFMDRIDLLDFESQALYKMSNESFEMDVCFAGAVNDVGVKTIAISCPLNDGLRADKEYQAALLAVPSLFVDILEANAPGCIDKSEAENMFMCVVNYITSDRMDEEYLFICDDFMVSIWYEPNAVNLWFDIM